jgi:hypothetical protein
VPWQFGMPEGPGVHSSESFPDVIEKGHQRHFRRIGLPSALLPISAV